MASITLTAPNAVVSTSSSVNSTGPTTALADTISSIAANLVDSVVDGDAGTDTLNITGGGTASMPAAFTNIEQVTLAAATSFTANDTTGLIITGSSGADTITLGQAVQNANGGAGNDTIAASSTSIASTIAGGPAQMR